MFKNFSCKYYKFSDQKRPKNYKNKLSRKYVMSKKIKILVLSFSYLFFIFVLFISFNAVIPVKNLPIIETKKPMIKKIENEFINDKDSIYEILRYDSKVKTEKVEHNLKKKKYEKEALVNKIEILSKEEVGLENKYSVQFMSLNSSDKSLLASNRLEKKLKDDNFDLKLIVKPKIIEGKKFFRILTDKSFSFNSGKLLCEKLKKKKYKCILIKL